MLAINADNTFILLIAFFLFFLFAGSVMLVLWIAMPFSVFGLKGILKEAAAEQKKTNMLLEAVLEAVQSMNEKDKAAGEKKENSGFPLQ